MKTNSIKIGGVTVTKDAKGNPVYMLPSRMKKGGLASWRKCYANKVAAFFAPAPAAIILTVVVAPARQKPTIDYRHIDEGELRGKCEILADGVRVSVIEYCGNGWTSSWQENTLSKVEEVCRRLFPDGFNLPFIVGGDGYVYTKKAAAPEPQKKSANWTLDYEHTANFTDVVDVKVVERSSNGDYLNTIYRAINGTGAFNHDEAVAKLIAAAPLMLEALLAIQKRLTDLQNMSAELITPQQAWSLIYDRNEVNTAIESATK